MSVGYRAVQWNRDKLVYDGLLLLALAVYVTAFLIVVPRLEPPPRMFSARSICASAPSAAPRS
jgi:hypothetical protein